MENPQHKSRLAGQLLWLYIRQGGETGANATTFQQPAARPGVRVFLRVCGETGAGREKNYFTTFGWRQVSSGWQGALGRDLHAIDSTKSD